MKMFLASPNDQKYPRYPLVLVVYYVLFSLVYILCPVVCLTQCVLVLSSEFDVLLCQDFTNSVIEGEGLAPVKCIYVPWWLGLLSILRR